MIKDRLRKLRTRLFGEPAPVVSVLRLAGAIGAGGGPLRPGGLSLAGLAAPIERAFRMGNVKAVALVINSPGGSAVQSSLIGQRIRALSAEHEVPVVAFVEDVAASGGYWLACAADEILAQEASIVGSIGVVSAGFGFPGLLDRLGIERRVHTAGGRKAQLDPFRPEEPEEVERLKVLLADIHEDFRSMVRERRGSRLTATDEELFSGEFWTGRRALALGLIDGFGEIRSTMRARYGDKVRLRVVGERQSLFKRLMRRSDVPLSSGLLPSGSLSSGLASGRENAPAFAAQLAAGAIAAVEERLLWSRYGL